MSSDIYYLDPSPVWPYKASLHFEIIRKLDFLLNKHPDNQFYQGLKEQGERHPFSPLQDGMHQ